MTYKNELNSEDLTVNIPVTNVVRDEVRSELKRKFVGLFKLQSFSWMRAELDDGSAIYAGMPLRYYGSIIYQNGPNGQSVQFWLNPNIADTLPKELRSKTRLEHGIKGAMEPVLYAAGLIDTAQPELRCAGLVELARPLSNSEKTRLTWEYMYVLGQVRGCDARESIGGEVFEAIDQNDRIYGKMIFSSPSELDPRFTIAIYCVKNFSFPDNQLIDQTIEMIRITLENAIKTDNQPQNLFSFSGEFKLTNILPRYQMNNYVVQDIVRALGIKENIFGYLPKADNRNWVTLGGTLRASTGEPDIVFSYQTKPNGDGTYNAVVNVSKVAISNATLKDKTMNGIKAAVKSAFAWRELIDLPNARMVSMPEQATVVSQSVATTPARIVEAPTPQPTKPIEQKLVQQKPPAYQPTLAFTESRLIQAVQANNKTGEVYEKNRFPITIETPLRSRGLEQLEADVLAGCRLVRQWTGNLDINTMKVDNFYSGEGKEIMHRVSLYHGSASVPMPQVIIREYTGFGGTVKIYGILGGETIASILNRNALANKRGMLQLALEDSKLILITASTPDVLQRVEARCKEISISQVSVTSSASPLLDEIRQIDRIGSRTNKGQRKKH